MLPRECLHKVFWLALSALALLCTANPVSAAPEYVGKGACGECHGGECQAEA